MDSFDAYIGNYEDSETVVLLKTEFFKLTKGIVTDYLRFSPEEKEYRNVLLNGFEKASSISQKETSRS